MHTPETTHITVGLSSHRLEVLPLAQDWMLEHEGVILEDPPEPDFLAMLAGEEDEIKAWRLSGLLSFEDCANLYPEVSQALPQEAGDLVQAYLARKAR